MQFTFLVVVLLALSASLYQMGRGRALRAGGGKTRPLHSLPSYYGYFVALWCGVPAIILIGAWQVAEPMVLKSLVVNALPVDIRTLPPARISLMLNEIRQLAATGDYRLASGPETLAAAERYRSLQNVSFLTQAAAALSLGILGGVIGLRSIRPSLKARNWVENAVLAVLFISSSLAVLTTIGIVLSLLVESLRFFNLVPVGEFLFGGSWSPQMAIRPDQVGASGAFGAVPLIAGTLLISLVAMVVAVPIGLLSAICLAEYAKPNFRAMAKPLLEMLAGIPTVVYGFFALVTVAPLLRDLGARVGLAVSSESALAAGMVVGVMVIPFISSLADDAIRAVPDSLRQASFGLGATHAETILQVVIPAALPGIVGGILLAVSRAIGETMIVVMAAGLAARLTADPLQSVTTMTVQIVTLLAGDQEFNSPTTLSAFALGLVLFLMTLALNLVAFKVVRTYREKYL